MITGRGSSINSNNRFAQHQYSADEGERLEDVGIGQSKFIEIFPKTIVNPVISPDVPLKWSLNPYQGCEHGCTYCYARPTHEYWGYSGGVDFEQTILVKKNAAELLRKKFDSKNWKGEAIMFSGNTDCYQPIERKLQITRQLLEVCNQYKNPVGIITKNSLVARDIDILGEMASRNQVQVVLSITSLQEKVRRILEPRTASVKSKLQTIEQLSAAKIPVAVIMAPIIPAITSHEIMDMAKAVSKAGATSLSYTIVRLNGCVEELFTDWLGRHFLDRKKQSVDPNSRLSWGSVQDQRFKTRMKGEGNFAELIHQQFKLACKKYNLNKQELPLNETAFHRFNAQTSLNF